MNLGGCKQKMSARTVPCWVWASLAAPQGCRNPVPSSNWGKGWDSRALPVAGTSHGVCPMPEGWLGSRVSNPQPTLTTVRCPFLALAMSSSEPEMKSMIPSLPCPTVNFMLWRAKGENSPGERGGLSKNWVLTELQLICSGALAEGDWLHLDGVQECFLQRWSRALVSLTCPGWCWRCWFCWPKWLFLSVSRSRGHFAGQRLPGRRVHALGSWLWYHCTKTIPL